HVNDGENDDPHDIYEMPVHRKHFHTTHLIRTDTTCQTEQQHDAQHDQACADVKGVQTDQRVIGRSEKVCGNRQSVLIDQPVPLLCSAVHEGASEHDCEQPQSKKRSLLSACEKLSGKMNRDTAEQQTDRVKDRCLQHVLRGRPCKALPNVK